MADVEPTAKSPGPPVQLGSYRLLHPLGAGGMSSVYLARHVESGHEVALKVLPRSLARKTTLLQRFLREAKSAEALLHPHIVAIYDRGMDDGRYYIVLEYLSGGDLHERVRREGPMPVAQAVEIIRDVALGLQYADQQGLIHRDIKPANLLLTADGRVKITDLGLALQQDDEDERVTRTGTTVGTVDYMAPEQARDSRATSVRSDIYSLGCTFYFLLAGEPPFLGSSVPDKLRRHASEPAPDVRAKRPDVPAALAELIRRMMAKKPGQRFVDYAHLIQALDELGLPGPVASLPAPARVDRPATIEDLLVPPGTSLPDLVALLDDDRPRSSGSASGSGLRPGGSSGSGTGAGGSRVGSSPGTGSGSTSGESGFRLGPGADASGSGTRSAPGVTRSSPVWPAAADTSPTASYPTLPTRLDDLDALSGLAGGDPLRPQGPPASGSRVGRGPGGSGVDRTTGGAGSRPGLPLPGPIPLEVVDEIVAPTPQIGVLRPRPNLPGTPPLVVALRLALGLIVLAFAGIGLRQLVDVVPGPGRAAGGGAAGDPGDVAADPGAGGRVATTVPPVQLVGVAGAPAPLEAAGMSGWTEPADPAAAPRAELSYPAGRLAELELEAAVPLGPARPPTPVVRVRRVDASRGPNRVESLRPVLDKPTGTAEIADDGPFFEDDLHVDGAERLVRAAEGFRPRIVAVPSRRELVKNRPALIVLDPKGCRRLTLEGLDLVVRAADLPGNQWAVFLCGDGTELTLRDCTITVEGPIDRPMAVVQVGEPGKGGAQPARVRFERTLVRGPGLTAVRIEDGPAEVTATGSVFLTGPAPAFVAAGTPEAGRSIALLASVVATSASVVELAGSAAGPEARPTTVRALASHFARAEGPGPAGLVTTRGRPGGGPKGAGVDWRGDANRFTGWPAGDRPDPGTAGGEGSLVRVTNLTELQSACPGTDPTSLATEPPWPAETQAGWAEPLELARTLADPAPVLAAVASPSVALRAWSLGGFEPLAVPPAGAPSQPLQTLDFDADASPWDGDLGRFLAERVAPDAVRVRVLARGSGWRPMSPVRLRPGLALDLIVLPPAAGADPLSWRPVEGAAAPALLDVRGAELRLENVRLDRGADTQLGHLVRVEQGVLRLTRCVLIAPWSVEAGGGGLIDFRNPGSRPLSEALGPPTLVIGDSVLITGGEAVRCTLGRGVVALSQTAIAAGSAALVLEPEAAARDRFVVDVQLERCTLAGPQELVRVGAWRGAVEGPDRPWLITTRGCVFADATARAPATAGAPRATSAAVLLRADPEALARGAVAWQSQGDAYEVPQFLVAGTATPLPTSFRSVDANWTRFWGPSHVAAPRSDASGVKLAATVRSNPDRFEPGDLRLAPTTPRAGQALDVGADLSWLNLPPMPPPGRPARNR